MKKQTALLASLFFMVPGLHAQNQIGGGAHQLRVIPLPQHVVSKAGSFKITSQTRIVLGEGTSREDLFAVEQLNAHLKTIRNAELKVVREDGLRGTPANVILLGSPKSRIANAWLKSGGETLLPEMKQEGYLLGVDARGITIIGASARGRYYGVMSLLQLIEREKRSVIVPFLTIRDWPQYGMRGITDDLSRGQVSTLDNFKKIIWFLAAHKLNTYMPYLEDLFVFQNHPKFGRGRGALTAAEVKELDAFAKRHHVEIIPIFQTLGHWENALIQPEYAPYAEFPGAHTLNVSDEQVYAMLDEMIGELSAVFSSPYFHIAADESWDVGLGANRDRVARSDLATVHAEHYKRVFEILKKYKKKPMMYGDIILNNPTILEKIPKDVVIVDWRYGASDRYSGPAILNQAGFPYVVSPAVWSFTGPFPQYLNTMVNVQNFSREGFNNGSLGLMTSNWNDHGGEALRELNYYGYAWTAECAWRPLGSDGGTFDDRYFTNSFGNEEAGRTARTIYTLLSNPLNQMHWFELWRHPMLPLRTSSTNYWMRVQSIESSMPLVRSLIGELRRQASSGTDQIPYLQFVADLNLWYAAKVRVGEQIKRTVRDTIHAATDSARGALKELARSVIADLKLRRNEFRTLWLATNDEANLQWLMMRYDRQADYWQETIGELEMTGSITEPLIESLWLYHPDANPGRRDSTAIQIPKAFFRKTFNLDVLPESAKLQLIGDTHARIWVNGAEVGEVSARRSLSLIVEHERIKQWNIMPLLKQGTNVIAVEGGNYNRFGSAGFNAYLEVRNGSVTGKIVSDSTWTVSENPDAGWQSVEFSDRAWRGAAAKSYPFPIVRPNFETGRLSWIEQ
ncbi:MAG: glycoside hydrolase family 20 zincin-like fold domain-containing protein [Bacteroidota bacterium]